MDGKPDTRADGTPAPVAGSGRPEAVTFDVRTTAELPKQQTQHDIGSGQASGSRLSSNDVLVSGFPEDFFSEYVPMDLFTAAAIGHYERLVELLLEDETDFDACNSSGWTPLMYAAYVGHDNAVNLLLDDGRLNVDICTPTGCTALTLAASCGNESVSYFLLQHGANVNMRDMSGRTALFYAACQGHKNMINILLDHGADIDTRESQYGMTPLMAAAQEGHEGVAGVLLTLGADIEAVSNLGHTARALAVRGCNAMIISLIDNASQNVQKKSIRTELGLSDDIGGFSPPRYDGEWVSKDKSPRKYFHLKSRQGQQQQHQQLHSPQRSSRHRTRRRSSGGGTLSDIQEGPAAIARLLSFGGPGSVEQADGDGDAARMDLPSPADAAVDRGLACEDAVTDAGLHCRRNDSVDGDEQNDDDGNQDDLLSGSDCFADLAASTVRAPGASSGDSGGSSPQSSHGSSSSMGRQLAELCSISDASFSNLTTLATSESNVFLENSSTTVNPHCADISGSTVGSTTADSELKRGSQGNSARRRVSSSPSTDHSSSQPASIAEFLAGLGLSKYLPLFEEQDVNMYALLTLTDSDLKEIGLTVFGPRRKITAAIARWHSQAGPSQSKLEQAYADYLAVQLNELHEQHHQCSEQMNYYHCQLQQEQELRSVTETCLLDERAARQGLEQNAEIVRKSVKSTVKQIDAICQAQNLLLEKLRGLDVPEDALQLADQCCQQLRRAGKAMTLSAWQLGLSDDITYAWQLGLSDDITYLISKTGRLDQDQLHFVRPRCLD